MRIIAGTCRSMPLKTPQGMGTRPTQDRIKETLFNIIQDYIPGCVFVDLFCGSGGIGLESLSRGGRISYFAENDRKVIPILRDNINFTKMQDKAVVIQGDARDAVLRIHEKQVDVVYLDPPYGMDLERGVFSNLSSSSFITEESIIILETNLDTDHSYLGDMGLEIYREKRYKSNRHLFIKRL